MTDQYQDSVEEQFAPVEEDQNVSKQSAQDLESSNAIRRAEEQDRNWAAMRQRQKEMEIALQQRDELLNRLLQQNQPQAKQEIVEEEEPDEEYVPAGKVKGIAKRTVQPLEKKIQELEARIAQQDQQKLINDFRSKYPDFDDVVNVETLEMLEKTEPELAATISMMKDPHKMGLASYKFIKASGILEQLPNARRSKEVAQKIEQSSKTVQTPQAYNKRPMAQAFKSTQADSTKLYEEMMYYASQASGL